MNTKTLLHSTINGYPFHERELESAVSNETEVFDKRFETINETQQPLSSEESNTMDTDALDRSDSHYFFLWSRVLELQSVLRKQQSPEAFNIKLAVSLFHELKKLKFSTVDAYRLVSARLLQSLDTDDTIETFMRQNNVTEVDITTANKKIELLSYLREPSVSESEASLFSRTDLRELKDWSCFQLELRDGYSLIWKDFEHLSVDHSVLLYCIPRRDRNGCLNNMWNRSQIIYLPTSSSKWQSVNLMHKFDDPFNGDKVFYGCIPKKDSPFYFYVKEKDGEGYDLKGAKRFSNMTPETILSALYCFEGEDISTLRDGVMARGDKVTDIGVSIYFRESAENGRHHQEAFLHFLDEQSGQWLTKSFSAKGQIYLLQYKSLTFVIGFKGDRWLKQRDGSNFRISFPGSYEVTSDGTLFPAERFTKAFENGPLIFDLNTSCSDITDYHEAQELLDVVASFPLADEYTCDGGEQTRPPYSNDSTSKNSTISLYL